MSRYVLTRVRINMNCFYTLGFGQLSPRHREPCLKDLFVGLSVHFWLNRWHLIQCSVNDISGHHVEWPECLGKK